MPFRMGPWEIAFALLIVLMVFGVGKLPQVGSAMGKAVRQFRLGQQGKDGERAEDPETAITPPD